MPDHGAHVGERSQGPVEIAAGRHPGGQGGVAGRVLIREIDRGEGQGRGNRQRVGPVARQPVAPVLVVERVEAVDGDVVIQKSADERDDVVDEDEGMAQVIVFLDQGQEEAAEPGPAAIDDLQQGVGRTRAQVLRQ